MAGPAIFSELLASFAESLAITSRQVLGLWGGGLVWYLLCGTLLTTLLFRQRQAFPAVNLFGRIFPAELYRHFSARISAWHFALYVLLWGPAMALLIVAPPVASGFVGEWLNEALGNRPALLRPGWQVPAVQGSVIVLAMSLASYLCHYASHRVSVLWSFHRAHHSVEALTLPATARDHPLDLLLIKLAMIALAGLAGGLVIHLTGTALDPGAFAIVGAVTIGYFTFLGVFNHTHIPLSLGWLNRVIMAPVMHQVHHSAELRHRDRNIGSFGGLMIWDWMFGTLYLPARDEVYRWGLNDEELGERNPHRRLRDFYLEPFAHAIGVIRGRGTGEGRADR